LVPAATASADDTKYGGNHRWCNDKKTVITNTTRSIVTGVMFIMITVGTITSPRFDRFSKTFAMREMKSNKITGNCAGIIKS
jgi:hypothetical protein